MSGPRDLVDAFGEIFDKVVGTDDALYVSPPPPGWDEVTGDPGTGSLADPFHSVATAIGEADGGRNVYLRGGRYTAPIEVSGISGAETNKIVVRPYHQERVRIDCLVEDFLDLTDPPWESFPAGGPEEYVSTRTYEGGDGGRVRRGAFLDTHRHTKLVTYHRVEDMRATSGFDPRDLTAGDNPDNEVWKAGQATGTFRNWFYMGPGLWFDTVSRRVHVRLSHTHNDVPGWPDYTGPTNANEVRLALSRENSHALLLIDCHHLRFENLDLRFGGEDTIRLRDCSDIEFDHVNVRGTSRAIRLEAGPDQHNADIVFKHCEIDGGLPTWFFRSDRKDAYAYKPVDQSGLAKPLQNQLGFATTGVLISSRRNASDVHIHHCKIFNGHDVCVFGDNMRFHHNWVHNINDDALFMGAEADDQPDDDTGDDTDDDTGEDEPPEEEPPPTNNAWIYRNVVTQSLTALSFATDKPQGQIRIFRNLIDLRSPTLGTRRGTPTDDPFRQGQLFKSNGLDGPFDLWNNTCLTLNSGAEYVDGVPINANDAGFTHYKVGDVNAGRRRAFNNIFVAAYPHEGHSEHVAFLPVHGIGPSDGNTYQRVGPSPEPPDPDVPAPPGKDAFKVTGDPTHYVTLELYADDYEQEENGTLGAPGFASFDTWAGLPYPDDDLRVVVAGQPGTPMEDDMVHVDRQADWLRSLLFGGGRGCYWGSWDRLRVGPDGDELFPAG